MRNQGGRKKPTPRRIEPKSTFGIYIPADIPQEACDFLNILKDNGTYSNDVIEIIVQYLEVRKFLNPDDPLDGVYGNLLDQVKARVNESNQANATTDSLAEIDPLSDSDPLADSLSEPTSNHYNLGEQETDSEHATSAIGVTQQPDTKTAVEETPSTQTAGFDLNKVLQRMKRNKSIGLVNQIRS
jgi:hypothetical protein